jgi:hypothetical protein
MQIFGQFILTFRNIYFWIEGAYAPGSRIEFPFLSTLYPTVPDVCCVVSYMVVYILVVILFKKWSEAYVRMQTN